MLGVKRDVEKWAIPVAVVLAGVWLYHNVVRGKTGMK